MDYCLVLIGFAVGFVGALYVSVLWITAMCNKRYGYRITVTLENTTGELKYTPYYSKGTEWKGFVEDWTGGELCFSSLHAAYRFLRSYSEDKKVKICIEDKTT